MWNSYELSSFLHRPLVWSSDWQCVNKQGFWSHAQRHLCDFPFDLLGNVNRFHAERTAIDDNRKLLNGQWEGSVDTEHNSDDKS